MKDKKKNDGIFVQSIVSHRNKKPYVTIDWGDRHAQLTPEEAREHAFGILAAAAAAILDAQLIEFATKKLGLKPNEAGAMLIMFRESRNEPLPSTFLDLGGTKMTPNEMRECASTTLYISLMSEMEAFLATFLLHHAGVSPDIIDPLIQDFREMRGDATLSVFED